MSRLEKTSDFPHYPRDLEPILHIAFTRVPLTRYFMKYGRRGEAVVWALRGIIAVVEKSDRCEINNSPVNYHVDRRNLRRMIWIMDSWASLGGIVHNKINRGAAAALPDQVKTTKKANSWMAKNPVMAVILSQAQFALPRRDATLISKLSEINQRLKLVKRSVAFRGPKLEPWYLRKLFDLREHIKFDGLKALPPNFPPELLKNFDYVFSREEARSVFLNTNRLLVLMCHAVGIHVSEKAIRNQLILADKLKDTDGRSSSFQEA